MEMKQFSMFGFLKICLAAGIFAVGVFGFSSSVNAATYFVGPPDQFPTNGNGLSRTTPFNSLGNGINAAYPGDTVYVMSGTYTPASRQSGATSYGIHSTVRHGSADQRIVIMKDPEALTMPVIDGGNFPSHNIIEIVHSYVTLDGLEITSSNSTSQNGIRLDGHNNGDDTGGTYGMCMDQYTPGCMPPAPYHSNGADGAIIQNCYLHDIGGDGLKISRTNDAVIRNNRIYHVGTGGQQQAIDLLGVWDSVISGNELWDNPSSPSINSAIFAKGGSQNVIIESNYIHDMSATEYALTAGQDTEGYNTRYDPTLVSAEFQNEMTIWDTANPLCTTCNTCVKYTEGAGGLNGQCWVIDYAAWYVPESMSEGRNIVFRGNVIVGGTFPLTAWNAYNSKYYNNTLINTSSGNVFNSRHDGMSGSGSGTLGQFAHHSSRYVYFFNNLLSSSSAIATGASTYTGTSVLSPYFLADNNLFYSSTNTLSRYTAIAGTDVNSEFNQDPLLVDFAPAEGSPAIANGTNLRNSNDITGNPILGSVETWADRSGTVRPTANELSSGFDIGAFASDAGADTTPPSSPSGLSVN